jgi:hypothetical protein
MSAEDLIAGARMSLDHLPQDIIGEFAFRRGRHIDGGARSCFESPASLLEAVPAGLVLNQDAPLV